MYFIYRRTYIRSYAVGWSYVKSPKSRLSVNDETRQLIHMKSISMQNMTVQFIQSKLNRINWSRPREVCTVRVG